MGRKEDLEQHIAESYQLLLQYEVIVRDSDRPKEISRCRRVIAEQWELIREYLDEYLLICQKRNLTIPQHVMDINNRFCERTRVSQTAQVALDQKGERGEAFLTPAISGVRNRWVLLAGVTCYQDSGISNLKVCTDDVRAIHDFLITQPGDMYDHRRVRLLVDHDGDDLPLRSKIIGSLAALADSAQPEDLLLFYFSGHGIEVEGDAYLLPRDAESSALRDTSVSVALVKHLIAGSQAHVKIIILDACHSGARIGKAASMMTEGFIRRVFEEAEGTAILSSCKQQEVSWEWLEKHRSAFTYYLLEGLEGAADFDGKGFVSVNDISRYVVDQVKAWAAKGGRVQTPTYEGAMSGDIILAYI